MTYVISFLLILFNLYSSFKNKKNNILLFSTIFFFWILYWGNIENPDYFNYSNMYYTNGQYTTSIEVLFIIIIKICNYLGLGYHVFLALVSAIGLYLMHCTVRRYAKNFSFVYVLYFLTPFFLDVIQIRNFLSTAIIIYSIKFLLEKRNFQYLIFVFLASLIHTNAVAYIPLLLINIKDKNRYLLRYITLLSFSFSIIILLNNKVIPFLNPLLELVNLHDVSDYTGTKTEYGYLIYWGLHLLTILMMYLTKRILYMLPEERFDTYVSKRYVDLMFWINTILIIYFPLYLLNSNFFRITRNVSVMNFIAFSILLGSFFRTVNKYLYVFLVFIYILITFYFLIYNGKFYEPILNNNFLM